MKQRTWTKEEEQLLIELSSKYYIREIAKVLNRTEGAIIRKANRMELEYITLRKKYTEEELNYIKDNWGIIPVTEMARNLKVSTIMIHKQADIMNLPKLGNNPYRKWTDEQVEKLRKLAPNKTITELAKIFKTTNEAIQTIALRNCINLIDEKIRWTEEDNSLLREYANTMDISEIAIKMDRSLSAVRQQVKKLGIQVQKNSRYQDNIWTEENISQLKELASREKTLVEISIIMNKKDQTIQRKAKELNLEIKKDITREWTEDDIQKLIKLSKVKKLNELVKELERTSSSIKKQAKKLGITIITDRKNWTEDEYNQLEQLVMIDKKTPKEIAKILGRTENSIIVKINRSGLIQQTNDRRFWTEAEEVLLSDLWGASQ